MPQQQRASYAVRVATPSDWSDWQWLAQHAFGSTLTPEQEAAELSVHEFDRSLGAYDGETLVGTTASYSLRMALPGAVRPVAGVSWVSVLPSHRRRGILSTLMRAQLNGLHEAQREPIAVLWASEPAIYGRYGYGAASRHLTLSIPRSQQALAPTPADPSLRLRLARDAGLAEAETVRAQVLVDQPGLFERDAAWAARAALDVPSLRKGASELRCVVVEDEGGVRGYARYSTTVDWSARTPVGTVDVRELHALDPAAYATVWRYLCDLDLTEQVEVRHRPMDDPILELLNDVRRALPTVRDGLFVRLVDVGRALEQRTYTVPVEAVVQVRDDVCPWNAGRWRLSAGPTGASCTPTDDEPDVSLSVAELGAVFLGGGSLQRLAAAGRVTEHRVGALVTLSEAFRHEPAPYCDMVF